MNEPVVIRCLIADDEPPARDVMRRYVREIPALQLVAECANAIQVLSVLQQQAVDLMFLDIRMPQIDGTAFLKTLKNPPRVIFTTAYAQYALEGYELDVVDYLMKPIKFERFLKAVNKAFPLSNYQPETATAEEPSEKKQPSFVYFRADRKMVKVMLEDILYIESMKDYVKVFTRGGVLITKQSISSVENMLPSKLFIRSHRSYIIALNQVKSFTSDLVEIENTEIPIGKLYRDGVMKLIEG